MNNLMITDEEKKEMAQDSIVADRPKYPYGLKLHIDEMTADKLQMKEPPQVGAKFMILAYAEVCEVRQDSNYGDEKKLNVSLQITDMDLKQKEKPKESADMAKSLYGE